VAEPRRCRQAPSHHCSGLPQHRCEAWSAVRPQADRSTPYWSLIDDWSNPPYGIWLASLGRLVDATTATPEMLRTFDWVIRLELLFVDALDTGASW
jgi:hypothetical protein